MGKEEGDYYRKTFSTLFFFLLPSSRAPSAPFIAKWEIWARHRHLRAGMAFFYSRRISLYCNVYTSVMSFSSTLYTHRNCFFFSKAEMKKAHWPLPLSRRVASKQSAMKNRTTTPIKESTESKGEIDASVCMTFGDWFLLGYYSILPLLIHRPSSASPSNFFQKNWNFKRRTFLFQYFRCYTINCRFLI